MKGTPFKLKQKLSPSAAKRKAVRDKAAAMSEWGKFKKRTAQSEGCPSGQDFDHASGKCISTNANRKKNSRSGATKRKYNY
mgnify:FL=1|tara:strand:+ start:288 stop:530 length:243 start_codon:yes stop_codon:yes gene_type:complete